MGGKGLEGKSRALVKLVFIERGMETDAEFWLGLIDVGGPQSNGSPFARMLETIDINSEDSEVKLLNWSVELEARAVLDREERRQLHIYTYIFCENFQSWYLPTSCYAYIRTQFVRIIVWRRSWTNRKFYSNFSTSNVITNSLDSRKQVSRSCGKCQLSQAIRATFSAQLNRIKRRSGFHCVYGRVTPRGGGGVDANWNSYAVAINVSRLTLRYIYIYIYTHA